MVCHRLAHERATALRRCRVLFDGPDDDPFRSAIGRDDPRYDVIRCLRAPVVMSSGQIMTAGMRAKLIALWYGLDGEAYLGKLRSRVDQTRTVGLVPFSPAWVVSTPSTHDPFYTICTGGSASPQKIAPSEIIPYVDLDPANPYGRGLGTGAALAQEIDTDDGAAAFGRAVVQNQGTPAGMLVLEGCDPKDVEKVRDRWREKYGGPAKAGQLEFTRGKAQFIQFQSGKAFAESVDLRKFLRDSFCHVHGVSPELFGILDGSTRDSSWVALHQLAIGSIVPWLEVAIDAEQAHLVPDFVASTEDACLGYSSPTPEDRDLQTRMIATAPGAFRVSDARRVAGLPPDAEIGDRVLTRAPAVSTPTQLPKAPKAMAEGEMAWALARGMTSQGE